MCKSVEDYLDRLRLALAGSDPATMQDALSDAEEHLTAALHGSRKSAPDLSEEARLTSIIEEYGSPKEIAAAYRIIEQRTRPELAIPSQFYERSLASRFVSVVYDPRAWGSLVYMMTSIITGYLLFAWAVIGLVLSLELLILIIGLPIARLVLLSFRGIALVEGRIVESLLGVRMPRRPVFPDRNLSWFDQLKAMIRDKRTWSIIGYMLLRLPLSVVYFSVAVVLFAFSLELVASPVFTYVFDLPLVRTDTYQFYMPDSLMPFAVLLGLAMFLAVLHASRGLGRFHGKLAKAMLVGK